MKTNELVDRGRPLKVFVGETERARIQHVSASCGMSVSSYLKRVGLGYEPKPIVDHDGIMEMMRCRGDLGRLGGLLKLRLAEHDQGDELTAEIRSLLKQIEMAAEEVRQTVRNVSSQIS